MIRMIAIHSIQFPLATRRRIMLKLKRALPLYLAVALSSSLASGQSSTVVPAFDVASVKPSRHLVGPDYNNQITYSPAGITGRNVTLKRLVAEGCHLQLNQVLGPGWLDQNEYDVDARAAAPGTRQQMAMMLQGLLGERFHLKQHRATREMRVYDLSIGKSGAKIHAVNDGDAARAGEGFHFHGDMRQFADLLAVQFSIPAPDNPGEPVRASASPAPVLDKTDLPGVFDFSVDIHPEIGTDMFTAWQRALQDQLGLRIESRKENVAVLVVDEATKTPTEN
jgi:uncharacterized protein (TIGR03435 family)